MRYPIFRQIGAKPPRIPIFTKKLMNTFQCFEHSHVVVSSIPCFLVHKNNPHSLKRHTFCIMLNTKRKNLNFARGTKRMEVFVISMTEDRYSAAEQNLKGSGFYESQIVRFPAVNGQTVDLTDSSIVSVETRNRLSLAHNTTNKTNGGKFIPSKGAIGCFLSHYKLWQTIATGLHDAIIVEDDIVFRIPNASDEIQKKWDDAKALGMDLLLLGSSKLPLLPTANSSIFKVMDHFFGTEAYVLSPEAAKRLTEKALPIQMQVDAYIGSFAASKKLKISAVRPSISGQNHMLESTVQPQTFKRQTLFAARKHWLPLLIFVLIFVFVLVTFLTSTTKMKKN